MIRPAKNMTPSMIAAVNYESGYLAALEERRNLLEYINFQLERIKEWESERSNG